MDVLVGAKVHILRRWIWLAEVVTSPNKSMAVSLQTKEPREEEVEANCAEERGIGWKIQWELMESSLATIGPHYMETKEPTITPIDW